jgi:hypothetical protein
VYLLPHIQPVATEGINVVGNSDAFYSYMIDFFLQNVGWQIYE